MLESFGDGEDEFVFEGAADDLHTDGKTFAGKADRDGSAGEASEIEPLRKAHGVAVAVDGLVVSFAVAKRRGGRNR